MSKSVRSLLKAAAILPLAWYAAAPQLASYCEKDPAGNFTKSFVTSDVLGSTVAWPQSTAQVRACSLVEQFPAS